MICKKNPAPAPSQVIILIHISHGNQKSDAAGNAGADPHIYFKAFNSLKALSRSFRIEIDWGHTVSHLPHFWH